MSHTSHPSMDFSSPSHNNPSQGADALMSQQLSAVLSNKSKQPGHQHQPSLAVGYTHSNTGAVVPGGNTATKTMETDSLTENMEKLRLQTEEQKKKQQQAAAQQQQQQQQQQVAKTSSSSGKSKSLNYAAERVIGNGSFGVVFQATVIDTGETVAIKKVLQDRRFKNRELDIMSTLDHPNVVCLKHCFYSRVEKDDVYLNLVMEFIPHRDIKPQNVLLNNFGSAKCLVKGEPNVSYICSRYYRAPELVFEATEYTTQIDVWSIGCVFAELLLGAPLFPGESGIGQLIEIIKVLGSPTKEEVLAMNPNHSASFKFPPIKSQPWSKVFKGKASDKAIDLISCWLRYKPQERTPPLESLAHPFFDELREPGLKLPNGRPLPPLFNFTEKELKLIEQKGLTKKLIPSWYVPTPVVSQHISMAAQNQAAAATVSSQATASSSSQPTPTQ